MPIRLPTHLDAAITADYIAGLSVMEICERHKVSRSGVRSAVLRQGAPRRPHGAPTGVDDATLAAIASERRDGAAYEALRDKYGVTRSVIARAIDHAILADWNTEMSVREIRRRYGVSTARVDRVRRQAGKPKRAVKLSRGKWPGDDELRAINEACARAAVGMPVGCGASSLVGW